MRKFNTRLFAGLLAVFCCMTALSATAYADGGYYEQSEDGSETPPSSIDSITISTESVKLPEQQGSEALTPDGNLTLIDDILQSAPYASVEEAAENKQFITVQSKNGNYFYIVIDRSGDTENVYFLNLVDEADLMALMENGGSAAACSCKDKCEAGAVNTACAVCKNNMTECMGKEKVTEKTPEPDPTPDTSDSPDKDGGEKKSGSGLVVIVLLLLMAGGGALYWFKLRKKKPDTKGPVDLDDYDYGDDEDEEYEDDFPDLRDRGDTGAFADRRSAERKAEDRRNKVVNINATTQLKVVLVKPERFENASEIADHLKEKRTVVINLESTNKDIARRLIDFLSGVAYAGEGKIKKVAANTYIITPYHVDIMGDLIDELENNGLYL